MQVVNTLAAIAITAFSVIAFIVPVSLAIA